MKFLALTALLTAAVGSAHAQAYGAGVDGQSNYRVSDTLIVNVTSSSTVSPRALAPGVRTIRMTCTEDCHYKIGDANAAATPSNTLLIGTVTEYFKVPQSASNYVAVVGDGADGKLYIDEMVP